MTCRLTSDISSTNYFQNKQPKCLSSVEGPERKQTNSNMIHKRVSALQSILHLLATWYFALYWVVIYVLFSAFVVPPGYLLCLSQRMFSFWGSMAGCTSIFLWRHFCGKQNQKWSIEIWKSQIQLKFPTPYSRQSSTPAWSSFPSHPARPCLPPGWPPGKELKGVSCLLERGKPGLL